METHVIERVSDCELAVRRTFAASAATLYRAWTDVDLMMRWWVPASFGITVLSAEMNAQTGGSYRFVFKHPAAPEPMAFFGRYLHAVPGETLVWTNEESPDGAVSSVTLTEQDGRTDMVLTDRFPSAEALETAVESGSTGAYAEQFAALDALIAEQSA